MNGKALVLLSGGLDSTTCLYWAKSEFDEIHAISFDYGQRHRVELEYAQRNALRAGCKSHLVVNMEGLTGRSPLVDQSAGHAEDPGAVHAMFTPGRNIIFLAIAAGKAYDLGIDTLVTGVCETDRAGFPDCRGGFVACMEDALTEGMGQHFDIAAPLLKLTKAETWKLGAELGIVDVLVEHTLTDYNGDETLNDWGRGKLDNDASRFREAGFREAKANGWL